MSEDIHVHPLLPIKCIWEKDWSVYPDIARIAMEDGKIISYYKIEEQPAPIIGKWLDRYEKSLSFGGYKYKQKCRGKRLGRRKKEEEKNGGEGQELF